MLGLYCAHSYVHNRKAQEVDLPRNSKGVDMAFFTACQALGLKVYVRPVRDPKEMEWEDEGDFDSEEDYEEEDYMSADEGYYDHRRFRLSNDGKPVPGDIVLKYVHDSSDWRIKKIANSFSERLQRIKCEREVVGVEADEKTGKRTVTRMGRTFQAIKHDGEAMYDDFENIFRGSSWDRISDVIWLNKPRHDDLQKAYLTYGNEPGLGLSYTYAAIVVEVPEWMAKRGKKDSSNAA